MKILVCGGRKYKDQNRVNEVLDELDGDSSAIQQLIHGASTGADNLAREWAISNDVPLLPFPADWYKDGKLDKSAGPRRNQKMIEEGKPDLVVAFPGDKGTADMVKRARLAGVEVREIHP